MVVIDAEVSPETQVMELVQNNLPQSVRIQEYAFRLIQGCYKGIIPLSCLGHDQPLYHRIGNLVHSDGHIHHIPEPDSRILPVHSARIVQILRQHHIYQRHFLHGLVLIGPGLDLTCVAVLIIGDKFLRIIFSPPYPGTAAQAGAESRTFTHRLLNHPAGRPLIRVVHTVGIAADTCCYPAVGDKGIVIVARGRGPCLSQINVFIAGLGDIRLHPGTGKLGSLFPAAH